MIFDANNSATFYELHSNFVKYHTRGLPKCPKMAVTDIGRLHEYAYRCQNASFQREK